MAQNSRFWVTSATPTGDQQASYSGADFADVWRAMGEGVISGHSLPALDGELACSDGGANIVDVAEGAAIVDGIYFESTAVENVNVPSAIGAENTRIDRIVVRVTWASYDAAITRIAGTDAASPSAPAITQTTETTYDLPLCQVLVDASGNVTVTDERTFLAPQVDDSTIEVDSNGDLRVKAGGISTLHIGDNQVTNAKLVDSYDVYVLIAKDDDTALSVADNLITMPVPDIHNGKVVTKLSARIVTPSSSGDVTIRVYNVTDSATVGTVTINAGSTIGETTTIPAPNLATNDILRIDVTSAGTGAAGLIVTIKVDKS